MDPVTIAAVLLSMVSGDSGASGLHHWAALGALVRRPFRDQDPRPGTAAMPSRPAGEAEFAALEHAPRDERRALALAEVLIARANADVSFRAALEDWWTQASLISERSLDTRGQVREVLRSAVADYGQRVLSDPRILADLLSDLLPEDRGLLVTGAEADVAGELLRYVRGLSLDPGTAVQLAAREVTERRSMDPAASRWVAAEFALALGYVLRADTQAAPKPSDFGGPTRAVPPPRPPSPYPDSPAPAQRPASSWPPAAEGPTTASAAPLSPPVSYDELVRSAFAELVHPGRLLFNPPDQMRLGQTERVEVRLTRTLKLDAELLEYLRGHGEPRLEQIPTAPLMAVTLKGEGFRIIAHSDEEQSVSRDDITTWEFDICARQRGHQRLVLSISLRVPVPGRPSERKSIPVREAVIDVQVGIPALVGNFMAGNWQWFVGTAIAIAAVVVAVLYH